MISERSLQRRCVGYHDIRMDGMTDLVLRAPGSSVLDIGCNRGLVGFEFANNGAKVVHGCDSFEPGIKFARELFIDLRAVESKFEVVDLTAGPGFLDGFLCRYDIVLMLATYHKLKRIMGEDALSELMTHFGIITGKFFGWRGKLEEIKPLDKVLGSVGLKRIHTSQISVDMEPVAAIWARR